MQARKATPRDLRTVFSGLAQRCVDETHAAGYTADEAKNTFRSLRKQDAVWAIDHNNDTVGIIGFSPDEASGHPIIGTYFYGTEAFFDPKTPSVRFGRTFMREMQVSFGNLPMVSMCYGTHPEIERWYRLMGYRFAEQFGVQRNFVLDPKMD
ncbi:hypothetical protein SAMN02927900_04761 [Rhizobium mongolense subsp. loessense]|uniref:N-acetyltransferase domain-containing protein n=1 Tax=Rhizobium mongolense subsp. loessense TaxID=158890 RepID=A0A1G4T7B8_9HYPH|nr:hypothetical protein [Rhizobium mongolense]SCW77067.1 hypothetical protein SAMN02927900_04761 [Rhizobium mongolense subsp. loessense]